MRLRAAIAASVLVGITGMPMPVSANHCRLVGGGPPPENIRVELTVPITTVVVGQPVPMILEVENVGSEPVSYSIPVPWDFYRFVVRDHSGHVAWVESHPLSYNIWTESPRDGLEPGERRIEPQVWPQTTCPAAGLIPGPSVPPGTYTAQAYWAGPFWASNIVDIIITE